MQASGKSSEVMFEMNSMGHDRSDDILSQPITGDSLLSFSKEGDNSAQWVNLIQSLQQNGGEKISKSSIPIETYGTQKTPIREQPIGASSLIKELNGVKGSSQNNFKEAPHFGKAIKNGDFVPSLKFPDAVVAFAQAAAKVKGESEKYLPGWPLLSKAQLIKCEKCSREFCSSVSHRRHMRVHRRPFHLDKDDLAKKRVELMEYWDKLSVEEAKQILSLTSTMLEDVSGSSILKALSSFVRKPGFLSLPQTYTKAGAALLDIVQGRSFKFPLPASELFSILDDASEKTFLCAGTGASVQKLVFGQNTRQLCLEGRNLVASLAFLTELSLENAWIVNKDAEALHYQKLLVEEEEAAQKKRIKKLEKKQRKKLRQKSQKERNQAVNGSFISVEVNLNDKTEEVATPVSESSSTSSALETDVTEPFLVEDLETRAESSFVQAPVFPDVGNNYKQETESMISGYKSSSHFSDSKIINDVNCISSNSQSWNLDRRQNGSFMRNRRRNGCYTKFLPQQTTFPTHTSMVWTRKRHDMSTTNSGSGNIPEDSVIPVACRERHDVDNVHVKADAKVELNNMQAVYDQHVSQKDITESKDALLIGTMSICLNFSDRLSHGSELSTVVDTTREPFGSSESNRDPSNKVIASTSDSSGESNMHQQNIVAQGISQLGTERNEMEIVDDASFPSDENIRLDRVIEMAGQSSMSAGPYVEAPESVELIDLKYGQQEGCNAVMTFLTKRWEKAIAEGEGAVIVYSDSTPSSTCVNDVVVYPNNIKKQLPKINDFDSTSKHRGRNNPEKTIQNGKKMFDINDKDVFDQISGVDRKHQLPIHKANVGKGWFKYKPKQTHL